MPCKKPVKKRSTRAADMEITSRGRREADADIRSHLERYLSTDFADLHRFLLGKQPASRGTLAASPTAAAKIAALLSLDEDFTGPAAHMSILRKVDFCNSRVAIEQRANALNYFETDIGDVARAQPFHDRATLKSRRQVAKFFDRKIDILQVGMFCQRFDPLFFFRRDHGRTPDVSSNVAPDCFFKIRNDAAADAIAQRRQIFVRRVFPQLH